MSPQRIAAFADLMREKLEAGDIQAQKAYLRAVISEVQVDDETIRIVGDRTTLAAVVAGQSTPDGNVRRFVRKWRTRQDSNL